MYNTLAECFQKLSTIHISNKDFFSNTEKYCDLTLEFKKEVNDFTGMAMLYNVRASFYSQQPSGYSKAKADLGECRILNEKLKNYKGLYYTYLGLASLDQKFNIVPSSYKEEAEKIKIINGFQ